MRTMILLLATAGLTIAAGVDATVKGWVIDSACTFTKQLDKPISRECAIACAKKGSVLVIQSDDGKIYLPISEQTPSSGQNARLMPFAGKRVVVTGKTYERGGSNAVAIGSVKAE